MTVKGRHFVTTHMAASTALACQGSVLMIPIVGVSVTYCTTLVSTIYYIVNIKHGNKTKPQMFVIADIF